MLFRAALVAASIATAALSSASLASAGPECTAGHCALAPVAHSPSYQDGYKSEHDFYSIPKNGTFLKNEMQQDGYDTGTVCRLEMGRAATPQSGRLDERLHRRLARSGVQALSTLPGGGALLTRGVQLALTVSADQVPGVHDAFSFDVDITAFLEHEAIAESLVNRLWHLNTSDSSRGFHPGCDVDGVAPHVVEEALRSDHAGDQGSARQTDPQRHRASARIGQSGNGFRDVEGEVGECFEMIRTWLWDAADHHVCVAAGFDLLQTVPGYQRVQAGVEGIEEGDQLFR